ncbi:trypsin iota-like [Drosophila guanche]|uniref:trypsin n=1 Tax=Drosophila guanche TaxID=7266 RepID=A0A3B0J055_DROGU|nr:trypsin iota-like [Drosophila guanche]SPP74015.1 blast:Trypsin iota [Drosophila guanche]
MTATGIVFLLFLLLGVTTASDSTKERIVGGTEQAIRNAPWQVSIQISARHECGGVIYSQEIIITAGHCVHGKSVTLMKVRVGAEHHNYGGTLVPVAAYKVHEQFDLKYLHYDIAVLRLSKPLSFGLSIKAINLARVSPASGTNATVSGWGYTAHSDSYAGSLQAVQLQIIEREQCASSSYGYGWDYVGEETICAAYNERDACTGDSGGPLVANHLLVGIVSWGYQCALDNYPGVYADVAVLRSWIVKAANAI